MDCGYVIEYKKKYEEYNPLYIQLVDPFLLFHYHHLTKEKKLDSYEDLVSDMGRYDNWRGQALKIIMISAKGLSGTTHTSYIADVITLDDLFEG